MTTHFYIIFHQFFMNKYFLWRVPVSFLIFLFITTLSSFIWLRTDLEMEILCVFLFFTCSFLLYVFFSKLFFFKSSIKSRRDRYRKNIKTHQKNITFYTLFFFGKRWKEIFFYIANRNEIYDFLYLERWMRCTDVWMDIATVYTICIQNEKKIRIKIVMSFFLLLL